ncbi:pentatricopeptide repeat-containing protein At3g09650, chloroplastic-like [Zingiber officinale]|uniref:pentatricopeptide repeat-containing protein At3g09650, chloroplastic-like n=1 Tax=Zingiber officinale TaxID=94328 RepID=UPI001C4B423E|nr:pentatricopeptide repeat-containing protein At3g09650, chloroplastic-like [Zingiber officinale]
MLQHAAAPVPPPFMLRSSTKQLDPVQIPAPKIRTHLAAAGSSSSSSSLPVASSSFQDAALLFLLRQRKTEEAYQVYASSPVLPGPTCLSRLLAQLSYQNTPTALTRARALVRRLRDEGKLHCLDANSLGLLAVSAARSGSTAYALALLRTMLRSGYLPHVKAWSAVVSRLSASEDGPAEALRLFDSVLRRLRRVPAITAADARPDAAAFNAALNACANLGDVRRFAHLFNEMPQYQVAPDVLTHNVLIKMCARAGRKDLLVFALRRIIAADLVPCITTLHSLVAAYVGFDDLETAEKLVQAMRDGRRDLCSILMHPPAHDSSIGRRDEEADALLEKLVMYHHSTEEEGAQPLLPKTYKPDTRMYTTLMKGYMKEGRVEDVVRMIRAMQQEEDPASHPDHVTYTTVITTLIKAGEMDRARSVLAEMARAGVPANLVTYNVLLKGYCQQLQLDKAKDLIREIPKQAGIGPNVVSYNILIDGCILIDDSAGALAYFNEMRAQGIAPSKVSYTTLMKAFALSGQPKLAHKVFDEMEKDPRVKLDRVAYNMLTEGYCRLGLLEEGKKIVEKMRQNGFEPDVATYGCLANGIALARKPGEALLLWNEVKERCASLPPLRPDEGLLDALADVCVRAAFFKKALEIVACMEENGISPNKTKYKRIYVEMHSRMFTSKHASQARQDRRKGRKRAAEAFKFWLGLPNSYYGSEWRLEPSIVEDEYGDI